MKDTKIHGLSITIYSSFELGFGEVYGDIPYNGCVQPNIRGPEHFVQDPHFHFIGHILRS